MIVHSIIKFKPPTPAPYVHHSSYQRQSPVTQAELDQLNATQKHAAGMFVKYYCSHSVHSLYQVFYICEVITDVAQLTYNYQGKPNNIKIMSLGPGTLIKRYDVGAEFVPLSDEEMAAHITNNDLLLHRIKAST